MTALVTELTDLRTTERDDVLTRYRDAIWRAARGKPNVDAIHAAARPLNLNPAQIGGNVGSIEAWIKAHKGYELYKEINVDKEHEKAKARLEKFTGALRVARADEARATPSGLAERVRTVKRCEDDLVSAKERFAHWVRQVDGQSAYRATMRRIEQANPGLFEGCEHETS